MKPWHRSAVGMAIALVSLPVFMSLLACLPVPIGDPEKSRIDPRFTGMWYADDAVVLLEPFDKRAWLMTVVAFDVDECEPESADDEADPAEAVAEMNSYEETLYWIDDDADCVTSSELGLYKVWRTELGGKWFMTWETMGIHDSEHAFATAVWFGFRIVWNGPDQFSLDMIDIDADLFDDIEILDEIDDMEPPLDERTSRKARRAIEKVIRRNVDGDIYEEDWMEFWRIQADAQEIFRDILDQRIEQSHD